jgi:tRNA dimethylallyltransferase
MTADTILGANATGNQSVTPGDDRKPPLIVIVGATASGKTAMALALADHLPVELVNADSRNFYSGMDIGTAKPSADEQRRVPHHLVDILEPHEPMSVSQFQALASDAIAGIHARGRIPVLVGGTPQYVNALVEGWRIPQVPPNDERRRELEREAAEHGVEPILARLRGLDPEAAERTGPNLRRIIRALEVIDATGLPYSAQQVRDDVPFRAIEFELWWPRDVLYERIDARVDRFIEDGLVDEVRGLLRKGYDPNLPAFSSIGYRQLVPAIVSGADLDEAVERIKLDTHRLVRHQQTWFRRNPRLIRIDMTQPDAQADLIRLARAFIGHPGA